MNFVEVKKTVAAYLSRPTSVFVVDGVDLLSNAVNLARQHAEKLIDFEFSKARAKLPSVSVSTGALFTSIVTLDGSPIRTKGIERAWTTDATLSRKYPLEILSSNAWEARLARKFDQTDPRLDAPSHVIASPTLILHGDRLYVEPSTLFGTGTTIDLRLHVVKWLPDYVADADTDFILDVGAEWVIYRSIQQLNFHLKEDQRLELQAQVVNDAWEALRRWNTSVVMSRTEELNLM